MPVTSLLLKLAHPPCIATVTKFSHCSGMGLFDPDRRQLDRIERGILAILKSQNFIIHQELRMSKELDDLTAEVAADTAVESSAVTLIQGLAAQIAAAGTDPVALKALTDSLTASSTALAAAVTANTPVAPAS